MNTLERVSKSLLLVLVVSLPFELRIVPLFSNLQWLFFALAVVSAPLLARDWRRLLRDRFVIVAIVFVLSQWVAALMAGELMTNSLKAAVRVSAGLLLACIVLRQSDKPAILKAWCVASIVAALYGLLDFAGIGVPGLFRGEQFYFEDRLRLSGSFEYPTTAAAYFAMSLPLMVMAAMGGVARVLGSVLLWSVLILTYSRGAAIAAAVVLLGGIGFSRRQLAMKFAAAAAALYAIIALFEPSLITRFESVKSGKGWDVAYELDYNMIRQRPRVMDSSLVRLKNIGLETWRAAEGNAVSISYHWYDTVNRRLVETPAIETSLPHDVRPNESVTVSAPFRTPDEPGMYLLDWDLKQKDRGWFSTQYRILVGIVEAQIEEDAAALKWNGDVSRWHQRGPGFKPSLDATVSRADLWKAAVGLFQRSPLLGVGPDNFRLLYGSQLGFERSDSDIRSNNLYLELLAGSGLIGLAAFIAMLASHRWPFAPASMAIAVFLLHGLVDVLLMTTPIYFGFWILMGIAHETN